MIPFIVDFDLCTVVCHVIPIEETGNEQNEAVLAVK